MNNRFVGDIPAIYQIVVKGSLDESWSEWLAGFSIKAKNDRTMITGTVADQVCLRGILERLWDLNFELISVNRLGDVVWEDRGLL